MKLLAVLALLPAAVMVLTAWFLMAQTPRRSDSDERAMLAGNCVIAATFAAMMWGLSVLFP